MKYIYCFLVGVSFLACKGDEPNPNNGVGDIEIKIWNGSEYPLEDVFVDTNGGQNDYGNLESQQSSDYKKFISAYRYAFVSFKIDGKAFNIQPIDYVGEELLEKGRYTYKVTIDDVDSQFAVLEFMED